MNLSKPWGLGTCAEHRLNDDCIPEHWTQNSKKSATFTLFASEVKWSQPSTGQFTPSTRPRQFLTTHLQCPNCRGSQCRNSRWKRWLPLPGGCLEPCTAPCPSVERAAFPPSGVHVHCLLCRTPKSRDGFLQDSSFYQHVELASFSSSLYSTDLYSTNQFTTEP